MKLMTEEIEKSLPKLYTTDGIPLDEKTVWVKYFSPYNGWTWYATEFDKEDGIFFGLVIGMEAEWGTFSLKEFQEVNDSKGFPIIERDLHFEPTKIKELKMM